MVTTSIFAGESLDEGSITFEPVIPASLKAAEKQREDAEPADGKDEKQSAKEAGQRPGDDGSEMPESGDDHVGEARPRR